MGVSAEGHQLASVMVAANTVAQGYSSKCRVGRTELRIVPWFPFLSILYNHRFLLRGNADPQHLPRPMQWNDVRMLQPVTNDKQNG
ncbi:MAG: hypothetical protein P8101_15875 [Candidatus Thiodiazotropha sp.]